MDHAYLITFHDQTQELIEAHQMHLYGVHIVFYDQGGNPFLLVSTHLIERVDMVPEMLAADEEQLLSPR